jgi:hypothetical protein
VGLVSIEISLSTTKISNPKLLRIPRKTTVPYFTVDVKELSNLEKTIDSTKSYCFEIPIAHLVDHLTLKWVYAPTAIFVREPTIVPFHLDGTMCGSILTLVQGEKKWRVISPFKKVMYYTTQKEGETIFIPPGFRHEVYTVSSS